ncbi:hypothetical protein CAMSH0001_1316 [Campylobacter showae RM3277]|uniref:Uncharacterized protein n=1 Tax=Campylobacter showae RM3277 TaxID=553219 RepID=C6RIH0_9BACT|nr:hypothetical protein CAMSH0001_1316 [Campylobacter showae RM3277]
MCGKFDSVNLMGKFAVLALNFSGKLHVKNLSQKPNHEPGRQASPW